MPLFGRKNKQDALVSRIAEEVVKATNSMASTPMGGSGYATTTAAQPATMPGGQGLLQTVGNQANPLPRPATSFGSQLGPAAPFLPAPLDPVYDDSGRALPRVWEYPVAWNLDLNQRTTPWSVLRSMADQIDIIHRAIELKVAELTKLDWSFTVEDSTINEIMAADGVSHAQAAKQARETYDEKINELREFWENPYPQLGRTFSEWLTEFLWQHFVFDGTPVYPRYNLGKNCIGFEIIDAPTIKVLLDNRGAIPEPPSPAFQQVLWGFPRGEYQATEGSDGEFFSGAGNNDEYLRDQLAYFVRNRRTWSPYGYSCVEQAVPAATLYLERQRWMKAEYQFGTVPMAFFETDSDEMDIQRLAQFDKFFNDHLTGQTAERMRTRVLPRGFKPVFAPTIDERYKSDYDNFLILRIATIFGVAPSALGVVPRSGLGGSGERAGEAQAAISVSQKPLEAFLTETINTLSRRFLGSDKNITFSFDDTDDNPDLMAKKANAYHVTLSSGQMTMNDVRGELGMPLYDIPEADEPFILAGNTIQFLRGTLEVQKKQQEAAISGTTGEESQGESASGEESAQKPQTASSSQTQKADVAKAELDKFQAFVRKRQKSGKWRDFDFQSIEADKATALNASGRALVERGDIPKVISLIEVVKTYDPNQPREANGRFGSKDDGGGGDAASGISFKTWDDVRAWGDKNGINIDEKSLTEIARMTPESMSKVAGCVEAMDAKFPGVKDELKGIRGQNFEAGVLAAVSGDYKALKSGGSAMLLTGRLGDAFANPEEFKAQLERTRMRFSNGTLVNKSIYGSRPEDTVNHELGHVLQNMWSRDELVNEPSSWRRVTNPYTASARAAGWVNEDGKKSASFQQGYGISYYASTNPVECHAELISLLASPEGMSQYSELQQAEIQAYIDTMNSRAGFTMAKDASPDDVVPDTIEDDFGLTEEFWDRFYALVSAGKKIVKNNYDPDQPRDEHGRFGEKDGESGAEDSSKSAVEEQKAIDARLDAREREIHQALLDKYGPPPKEWDTRENYIAGISSRVDDGQINPGALPGILLDQEIFGWSQDGGGIFSPEFSPTVGIDRAAYDKVMSATGTLPNGKEFNFTDARDAYVVDDEKTLSMNRGLRNGRDPSQKALMTDWAISQTTTQQDIVVNRSMFLTDEQHADLQVGTQFTDKGFQSTQLGMDSSPYGKLREGDFPGTTLVSNNITVPAGMNVGNFGYGEVVLPRDTTLEVVARTVAENGTIQLTSRIVPKGN